MKNSTFIDAAFGKRTDHTPIWIMRQAGRYLPEYRQLKRDKNILDIVKDPNLSAKICLTPVDVLNVDAAILYADIMIPLLGIGVDLEIIENLGPVIKKPLKTLDDVIQLKKLHVKKDIPYLLETIKLVQKKLDDELPLIGFSAAPFTLAGYLIEGKPSRDFIKTKLFMYKNLQAWNLLMDKLTELIITYLKAQVAAGVNALQLFDSWIGFLGEDDYQRYVLPHTKKIFSALHDEKVPLIHFGTNTAGMLKSFASVDCDVVGVDWRISLDKAWQIVGSDKSLQGNLDPVMLLSDFKSIQKKVNEMFATLPKREGYIFNLGHGILPDTPKENVIKLVKLVHQKN